MRPYRQLSLDERYQIHAGLRLRQSIPEIAAALGRSPSTIYREIERNQDPTYPCELTLLQLPPASTKYNPGRAQGRAAKRRVKKGEGQRKIRGELQAIIESKLRLSWSPEQICGRLRAELRISISHETIYQHILREEKQLGFYRHCLRYGGSKHHRFKRGNAERKKERQMTIEDRPAAANDRSELGHWERDCLLGKRGGGAILALEDRMSRFVRLRYVQSLDPDTVAKATEAALRGLDVKTITNDNGIEFQRDESLMRRLGADIYFCNPSSPWERGSIENTNGLMRQYLPKRCDLETLAPWGPVAVENTLNFRPRKVLGFKTPYEVFYGTSLDLLKDSAMQFGLEFSTQAH